MAFPQIVATQESTASNPGSGTFTVTLPDYDAGDLVILLIGIDTNVALNTTDGFTVLQNQTDGTALRAVFLAKEMDGTEGSTADIDFSGTVPNAICLALTITGFYGDIDNNIDVGTANTSDTGSINPPSVTAGWGSADNLYIAGAMLETSSTPGAETMANYTEIARGAYSGDVAYYWWYREYASASDNPAASSTLGFGFNSVATTIVIRPQETTIIEPDGVDAGSDEGAPRVNLAISPSGRAATSAAGAPVVSPQAVTISPDGVAAASEVGELVATFGTVIALDGIAAGSAAGTPVVAPQPVTIEHEGIDSTAALGTQVLAALIQPTGRASAASLGTQVVAPQPFTIVHSGIASGAALGSQKVNLVLVMTGVASGEVLGALVVDAGSVTIAPDGVASGAGLGALVVLLAVTGLTSPPAGTTYSLARLGAGSSFITRQPPGGRSGL